MLNSDVGSITTDNGLAVLTTTPGRRGHALFGPYESQEAGSYLVKFTLHLAESVGTADFACAVVDVTTELGRREIASRLVFTSELSSAPTLITLPFAVEQTLALEYRVHVNDSAVLAIVDTPDVEAALDVDAEPGGVHVPKALRHLYDRRVKFRLNGEEIVFPIADFMRAFGVGGGVRADLARQTAEAIGYKGDGDNSLYRAFVGTERSIASPPARIPFTSSLCQQAHFSYDQYRFWTRALKEAPKFQRKQWEFVYVAQTLHERGYLEAGRKGLVFGAGQEQLPALFASLGVEVLATDQTPEAAVSGGWIASGQHTYDLLALNQRDICDDGVFRKLVSYRAVDMNDIPGEFDEQFDFCWSACALEHLGSLDSGLTFIENSLRTLKPGGLAVHTTEYNLSSDADTIETQNLVLYRRRDIDAFIERMTGLGMEVSPIDWEVGEGFAEMVVDLPPFGRGEPHIRLKAGEFDTTSIGLIIRKPAAPTAAAENSRSWLKWRARGRRAP